MPMSSRQRQYCRDHDYGTYIDEDPDNDWGSESHSWKVTFPCGWQDSFATAVHGGNPDFWPYTRDGESIEPIAFLMHFHRHGKGCTNYVCDVCRDEVNYSLGGMIKHVKKYHDKAELLSFFGYKDRWYILQQGCVVS